MQFLTKIDYMKNAKRWIAFSAILTAVFIVVIFAKGFNLGVDFTGGTVFTVQFTAADVTQAQVEDAFARLCDCKPTVQEPAQTTGSGEAVSEFFVRTPELTATQREQLKATLDGVGPHVILSEDQVSATISNELTTQALLAVAIAAVLQIIYLWFRFEFKFGITAVLALLHDVVITLGLVSIFGVEVNAAFVAAILTILGYSINDTVVVFDRIRENLASRKKTEGLDELATRSIQETIVRSWYTGISVQMGLLTLIFLGGESIRDFALTLFMGVTAGMYSSIFIAAAIWLYWQKAADRAAAAQGGKRSVKA